MSADPGPAPVLLSEVSDGVGTITLNRPERRNALNGELILALDAAVRAMADDPDVAVVVLTGAAAPGAHGGFCAGGDLGGIGRRAAAMAVPTGALEGDLARHDLHPAMLLHLMPKPTIAMIGGPAIGAGCSLAGACDLRYASDDAVFAANFTPIGLSGDFGGSLFWTRVIGTARARELYLLNDRIDAARALAWGMVHDVVPAPALRDHTLAIARRLAATPAALLALVKGNLNAAEEDAGRRRYLFAHEAVSQQQAAGRLRPPPAPGA